MEAVNAKNTLLSAAKNFIRKSAGTAAVVIAPLAAVSLANHAKAQTVFGAPSLSFGSSGSAITSASFPSGSRFVSNGPVTNGVTALRLGATGTYSTLSISGGIYAYEYVLFQGAITNAAISGGTTMPIAFDFTLSKTAGTLGSVNWQLDFQIDFDDSVTLGCGTLTDASTTFTGSNGYTTVSTIPGDGSVNYRIYLHLDYDTAVGDALQIAMNSGSQGITVNVPAIPEPSSYAFVLGLGVIGFTIVRRSRRSVA